jgi:hypothetical protein
MIASPHHPDGEAALFLPPLRMEPLDEDANAPLWYAVAIVDSRFHRP